MADDRNVPTSRPCAKDQNRTSHNLMCASLPLLLSPLHPPRMRLRLGYDQFHHLSLKLFDDFHMSGIKKATTSIFMCAKGLNRLGLHLVCVRVFWVSSLDLITQRSWVCRYVRDHHPFQQKYFCPTCLGSKNKKLINIVTCAERQSHRKNPVTLCTCASRLPALHLPKVKWLELMLLFSHRIPNSYHNKRCAWLCFQNIHNANICSIQKSSSLSWWEEDWESTVAWCATRNDVDEEVMGLNARWMCMMTALTRDRRS